LYVNQQESKMLEYKKVSVSLPGDGCSSPVSFMASPGQTVCLCGPSGCGKSRLLKAAMALEPVRNGFITIDGEPVDAGSGSYFRQMISYVPQALPETNGTTASLFEELFALKSHRGKHLGKKALLAEWQLVGLDASLYTSPWLQIDETLRRRALLTATVLLQRPILLVDSPVNDELTARYLQSVAQNGVEVICASRTPLPLATQTITLSTDSK
jgi:ABC-type cobalamin/Fe3+-siderophores transport system ATPase subunit